MFGIITLVAKRLKPRNAIIVLGCALFIQIADTSAGWSLIRNHMMAAPEKKWITPLVDPFWVAAANRYKKIRVIPLPESQPPQDWKYIDQLAVEYGLKTNAAYLARINTFKLEEIQSKTIEEFKQGIYEKDTLYILNDSLFQQAKTNIGSESHLIEKIDGLSVMAPNWNILR